MRTKIERGLFCFLLFIVAACSEGPSIGTLIHEGPVARGRPTCFAAVDASATITWVSADGRTFAAPETEPPLDLAYDPRAHELLAVTDAGVMSLDPSTARVTRRRAPTDVERVWPLADGLLVMQPGGLWTHERDTGAVTSRWLPEALSIWEEANDIFWVGAAHPRARGPVLVHAEAASPLTTAALVDAPAIPAGALAAPGFSASELLWAQLDDRGLVLTHADEELVLEVPHRALKGLAHLEDAIYAIAFDEPSAVLLLDWTSETMTWRDELRGPIAGPVPCPPALGSPP